MRVARSLFLSISFLFSAAPVLSAQAKAAAGSLPAHAGGPSLTAISKVSDSVTVDAVLLPRPVSERLFGKEIAKRFVAVQLTISNRSSSAGLILHSVLLDYSQWLFSGNFSATSTISQPVPAKDFQQQNEGSQVASTEARLVRSDLQDAQTWRPRNWILRAATLAGTGASAFSFVTADAAALAGISAYGNQVIPALNVFWPDSTQAQIDRISDFGFQDNRVIGKNSSETVVAFFPIDRFLTANLKAIYFQNPAAFFVPTELLIDKSDRSVLVKPLKAAGIVDGDDKVASSQIIKAIMHYQACKLQPAVNNLARMKDCIDSKDKPGTDGEKNEFTIVQMLAHVSLNNIRIMIGGVMTVDVNAVPAVLKVLNFANGAAWATAATPQTATLTGSFLSDGTPTFSGDAAAAFTNIVVDTKNSTDTSLLFSYTLGANVTNCQSLTVTVSKTAQDGTTTSSAPLTTLIQTDPATPCAAQ